MDIPAYILLGFLIWIGLYIAVYTISAAWQAGRVHSESKRRSDDIEKIRARINTMKEELGKILTDEEQTIQ
jgi:hypothetical protein